MTRQLTNPQIAEIDREIRLIKSGAMRGDFARRPGQRGLSQAEQRMIRQLEISKMTPEQRERLKQQEAEAARYAAGMRSRTSAFKSFGEPNPYTKKTQPITKATFPPALEQLRQLSLDDSNPDQWRDFHRLLNHRFQIGSVGSPLANTRLLKLRFNWGPDGRPRYVAPTLQMWQNYFSHPERGRWIANIPFTYKCPPEWAENWAKRYLDESNKYSRRYPNTSAQHLWPYKFTQAKCKKPKKSLWVQIRKPLAIAAGIVAAVYLGPVVVEKIGAIASGGSGAAAGTAGAAGEAGAKATFFSKVKAGSAKVLKVVNRARSIKAIAEGELPPPPIGIPGSNFREWVTIVAKEKLKEEAQERALELGVKYVQKKMTEKEEKKLQAEIAQLQRELERLIPPEVKEMPPEPAPELAAPVKKIQAVEEQRALDAQDLLLPAAIVGGALLLGG